MYNQRGEQINKLFTFLFLFIFLGHSPFVLGGIMESKFSLAVEQRWWVLLLSLVAVVSMGWGASTLKFNSDYRIFFSDDNPQLQAYEALQNTFTKDKGVLMVFAPKDGQVFSRQTLALIDEATELGWQVPYSRRVNSLSNFQYTHAEGDDLIVENLVKDPGSLSDGDLQRIRAIALAEPELVNRLVSPDGHYTGINITTQLPEIHPDKEVPEVAHHMRALRDQLQAKYPQVDIYLAGSVMMDNAFPEASAADSSLLMPLMFVIILAVLWLMLHSIVAMAMTMLVVVFAIVSAMGLAGWLGIELTTPSASAPLIILTVTVADCVHLFVSYFHELKKGKDKYQAMKESLRINAQPIFLTSLTTAVGFLSLNFSDSPPFHDLGNIAAMGVAFGYLFSMLFLPAATVILPATAGQRRDARGSEGMRRLGEFVVERRNLLFWGMLALMLVLTAFIPANTLNDNSMEYFGKRLEFRQAADFAQDHLTGMYQIEYSLKAGDSGGVAEPEYLRKVEAFAQWYRQQPEVLHVGEVSRVFKRLNKNMHADDEAWYRLPDSRELAAQYLLLYEMSLPMGLDLNNQINVDKSISRMTVTLKHISANQVLEIEERAQAWLAANMPGLASEGASPNIMFAHITYANIRGMLYGTTTALVLISLILVVALRSVKIGLISMVPNLMPLAMAFGMWGLLVGQIGLAASAISAIVLGIVVDDTVHFLSKYLRARREQNMQPVAAVRYAFTTVGTALWVTSLVLVAGFLILALSTFQINAQIGVLTAIAIGLALLADFFFLPPLLMRIDKGEEYAQTFDNSSAAVDQQRVCTDGTGAG